MLIGEKLLGDVVEARWKSDEILLVKCTLGEGILNIINVYTPQVGLDEVKLILGGSR